MATLVGLVLGAAVAAGAAYGILPIYYDKFDPQEDPLIYTLITHGTIWATVGTFAGLAFGLGLGGRGRWVRGALGGLLGGIAATMLYDMVGALAFPLDKTSDPIAATLVTRIFRNSPWRCWSPLAPRWARHPRNIRPSMGRHLTADAGRAPVPTPMKRPRLRPSRVPEARPPESVGLTVNTCLGADDLAIGACAERPVNLHVDGVLDETDAAIGHREVGVPRGGSCPRGESVSFGAEPLLPVSLQFPHGCEFGGRTVLNSEKARSPSAQYCPMYSFMPCLFVEPGPNVFQAVIHWFAPVRPVGP